MPVIEAPGRRRRASGVVFTQIRALAPIRRYALQNRSGWTGSMAAASLGSASMASRSARRILGPAVGEEVDHPVRCYRQDDCRRVFCRGEVLDGGVVPGAAGTVALVSASGSG